jgi:hypothetical protein
VRPVSARFPERVAASGSPRSRAVILTGAGYVELEIDDGSVTLDRTAASRGRVDLTITGKPELVPDLPDDLLMPYGNEVLVQRGFEDELVSLGIFRLEDLEIEDAASGIGLTTSADDRSKLIIDAAFEDTYQVAAGTNIGTAIAQVIFDAYPGVVMDFATTEMLTPALTAEAGDDRWDFAQGLAEAAGMVLYFDGAGVLVLRPAPVIGSPVFSIAEGEGGVLLGARRSIARGDAPNRVIVTGENVTETGPIPRGVATDDDPLSPTYYHGRYGHVPFFYSSEKITDDAQAAHVAEVILAQKRGITEQVTFDSLVNPALEPGDAVQITRERTGINQVHMIDTITIPLSPSGTMSGTTRAVRIGV